MFLLPSRRQCRQEEAGETLTVSFSQETFSSCADRVVSRSKVDIMVECGLKTKYIFHERMFYWSAFQMCSLGGNRHQRRIPWPCLGGSELSVLRTTACARSTSTSCNLAPRCQRTLASSDARVHPPCGGLEGPSIARMCLFCWSQLADSPQASISRTYWSISTQRLAYSLQWATSPWTGRSWAPWMMSQWRFAMGVRSLGLLRTDTQAP